MVAIAAEHRRFINLEDAATVSVTREPSPHAVVTIGPEDARLLGSVERVMALLKPDDGTPEKFRQNFQRDIVGLLEGI